MGGESLWVCEWAGEIHSDVPALLGRSLANAHHSGLGNGFWDHKQVNNNKINKK